MTALNPAILIGLATMGAYAVARYGYGNKRIERDNKEWERSCRELRDYESRAIYRHHARSVGRTVANL